MSTEEADPEESVACLDEQQAHDEAARRAALDPASAHYYWAAICLDGQWCAKRYLRTAPSAPQQGFLESVGEVILGAIFWWR